MGSKSVIQLNRINNLTVEENMDINVIPTWQELVDRSVSDLLKNAKENNFKPDFLCEIKNHRQHGTCRYFFGCADEGDEKSFETVTYGRVVYISFSGIFSDKVIEIYQDVKVLFSKYDTPRSFRSVLMYMQKNHVTRSIRDSVELKLRRENLFYTGERV
jgi:hypothetical protein